MADRRLEGLALKVGPLGEHDRLLTLLSDQVGVIRLAVPGARKPKSSLAAAVPLTQLELQVVGRRGLPRVRQLRVQHNFGAVGQFLELRQDHFAEFVGDGMPLAGKDISDFH